MVLQNNDVFPSLTFARTGGGEIHLPGDLAGGFGVILFHRGSWCPYCNAQLAAFARAADKFAEEGIKVVSVSVDDREKSEALVEQHKLGFSVAYGADARAVSAVTGAFVNDNPVCLQATGFVLNPEGRIVTAVYSTRAIGRLMPDDVLSFVRHLRSSAKN
ncbi:MULTISPECIES: redoxin domain-containing protein [unclassified Bradyrhizobium]|uniref:redoxin domain-containing protein n=1 Tax=unclassified Bradyrhizobium TaxID=2631580 RepID=UPI002479769A|nr:MULTISPECIES: redoxin domain-containing protein [unclassified Bradyrhizobium]WGS19963.1 peroxiredoxin family protein [Bradyrhizobium sp. ISRA463]WGS26818.1 peroxiredoxin family protein [Bradyrhizobium sp. ISRA464]